jgi:hypothetical protein
VIANAFGLSNSAVVRSLPSRSQHAAKRSTYLSPKQSRPGTGGDQLRPAEDAVIRERAVNVLFDASSGYWGRSWSGAIDHRQRLKISPHRTSKLVTH